MEKWRDDVPRAIFSNLQKSDRKKLIGFFRSQTLKLNGEERRLFENGSWDDIYKKSVYIKNTRCIASLCRRYKTSFHKLIKGKLDEAIVKPFIEPKFIASNTGDGGTYQRWDGNCEI